MKKTKDGGAILEMQDGSEIKISKREFLEGKMKRGLIRFFVVLFAGIIDWLFMAGAGIFTIGIMLIMLGWWMKTGW
jgi:hypothetical protein